MQTEIPSSEDPLNPNLANFLNNNRTLRPEENTEKIEELRDLMLLELKGKTATEQLKLISDCRQNYPRLTPDLIRELEKIELKAGQDAIEILFPNNTKRDQGEINQLLKLITNTETAKFIQEKINSRLDISDIQESTQENITTIN